MTCSNFILVAQETWVQSFFPSQGGENAASASDMKHSPSCSRTLQQDSHFLLLLHAASDQKKSMLCLLTSCLCPCLCLWSENGSGGWTSDSGCCSPCSRRMTTRTRKRKMTDDAVSSSSCSGCHPRCQTSADPCWLTVSWHNTHKSRVTDELTLWQL